MGERFLWEAEKKAWGSMLVMIVWGDMQRFVLVRRYFPVAFDGSLWHIIAGGFTALVAIADGRADIACE